MKVIFLDVDDCLNSSRTAYSDYVYNDAYSVDTNSKHFNPLAKDQFDWTAIKMLQRFQKDHNVVFVLSSTWRKYIKYSALSKVLGLNIISKTINDKESNMRGREIEEWLLRQPVGSIEQYAIIDDDSDMLIEQKPNFVHVPRHNGITFENMLQLAKIFNVDLIGK
jgi:hypothetical protein